MNAYYQNNLLRMMVAFTLASDGTAADPTSVSCVVTDPRGVTTTPAVVKDSTGNYHADVIPTVAGRWYYTFAGTGAVVAQGGNYFFVEGS